MICENKKCSKEHDGSFGSGRFCSRGCANSRIRTEEHNNNLSVKMKQMYKDGEITTPYFNLSKEDFDKIWDNRRARIKKELLEADFCTLKFESLRKRVIIEQDEKCNKCGIHEWLGSQITLELEHKDGNNKNNDRENLECLCPNCHSQTETWRGKNKKGQRVKVVKDEEIFIAFSEEGNIRKTLLKLGMAAKGANYGRVKRVLTMYGVDYRVCNSEAE